MSNESAIKVSHVVKTFKLPHEKNTSIKGAVLNFYKRNKSYEKQQVLNDVSFDIKKGEFFGIVGRNGSGKSTLLKLMAGIYTPDQGSVEVNGKLTPFIELGVGFSPELTGRENIFLNGALLGFSRKEMIERYDEIVAFSELEKFMDQKLKNYSSGMQVRLAFSIAIQTDSDILVLDEVLAVGDESFQRKCAEYFDKLKKASKTVILVTHDMNSFNKYCDRGVLIDGGTIVYAGEPILLSAEYKLLNSPGDRTSNIAHDDAELTFDGSIQSVLLNGAQSISLKRTQELTIDIKVLPKTDQRQAYAGVSIVDSDGVFIAFHNSSKTLKDLHLRKGEESSISYTIRSGQFMPGTYRVDVALYDKAGDYIDLKSFSGTFVVSETDSSRAGIVDMQGDWSHE